MPAPMPCKTSLCRSSRETCSTIGEHKTKYACIVEADEPMRIRTEGAPHRYHEDHIKPLQSSAQIYSCASSSENTRCKSSSGERMGKIRRQGCGKIKADDHEPDFNCLDQFLIREPSDCVEEPGDTQSIFRET